MTVAVLHSTAADGTFSGQGRTAWNAGHNITGLANSVPFFDSTGALADSALFQFNPSTVRLTVGTGATTSAGLILGYGGDTGQGRIWSTAVTPSSTNWGLNLSSTQTDIQGSSEVNVKLGAGTIKTVWGSTAGLGPSITAGTATTDVNALSLTQTWNAGGVTFSGVEWTFTDTASAAGTLCHEIKVGASTVYSVSKGGAIKIGNAVEAAVAVASTHKVTFDIAGTTYYLLATNVA